MSGPGTIRAPVAPFLLPPGRPGWGPMARYAVWIMTGSLARVSLRLTPLWRTYPPPCFAADVIWLRCERHEPTHVSTPSPYQSALGALPPSTCLMACLAQSRLPRD